MNAAAKAYGRGVHPCPWNLAAPWLMVRGGLAVSCATKEEATRLFWRVADKKEPEPPRLRLAS